MNSSTIRALVAKKKIFTILLALGICTGFARAEIYSGSCGNNLTWSLNTEDSTLTIEGTGAMYNWSYGTAPWYGYRTYIKDVNIQEGTTNIGKTAFYSCENLKNVHIPNGVKTIDERSFYDCHKLSTIEIPNSVTTIGWETFRNTGLRSITIPQKVSSIGTYAFLGCNNLSSFSVAETNTKFSSLDGVLYDKNKTLLVRYPNAKQGSYSIPSSVTTLGREAFMGNLYLEEIVVPNNVTSLEMETFRSCKKLVSVRIGSGLANNYIDENTFSESNNLESIIVSENNTYFSSVDGVLYNKSKSKLIRCPEGKKGVYSISDNTTIIEKSAFQQCTQITNINIPNTVNQIGNQAFWGCGGLTEVTIPNKVWEIGTNAFRACWNLTSIIWNVEQYGDFSSASANPFGEGTNISSFTFGENVVRIPAYLCYRMTNLSSITIPENVSSIGDYAFAGCYNLISIYNLSASPQNIYGNVFEDIDKTACNLIVSDVDSYKHANIWKLFSNIIPIETENASCGDNLIWSINLLDSTLTIRGTGAMYSMGYENYPWRIYSSFIKNIILSEGITSIGSYAFLGCPTTSLTVWKNTPPDEGYYSGVIPSNCSLYIPAVSIDAYMSEQWWQDFKEIYPLGNELVIQFEDWDHSVISRQFVEEGSAATPPANPTREGYTFIGWDKEFTNITEDLVVTAQYKINRFEVVFKDWDGVVLRSDSVDWNTAAIAPTNPSREGYTFIGWDKEFSQVTENMTITAQYELGENKTVTVIFANGNDESEILSQQLTMKVPSAPSISGFTFLGWYPVASVFAEPENTITIQAVYQTNTPTSAPAVYTNPANPAQKLIRNGNVYILTDDKTYTITGQQVK